MARNRSTMYGGQPPQAAAGGCRRRWRAAFHCRDCAGQALCRRHLAWRIVQHRFFTLLQNYTPNSSSTGMKVDLQLSAFSVYNQQANLELTLSAWLGLYFVNVTFILAARWWRRASRQSRRVL